MVKEPSQAIYKALAFGPTFGGGHDIKIADDATDSFNSFTQFGHSYSLPSGVQDQKTVLAGSYYFSPNDLEVFHLA